MRLPLIHLNGTSNNDLLAQQCEVSTALQSAISAMRVNGPNARDYYPQGPNAYREAMSEHCARIEALQSVLRDVNTIADYLASDPDEQREIRHNQEASE